MAIAVDTARKEAARRELARRELQRRLEARRAEEQKSFAGQGPGGLPSTMQSLVGLSDILRTAGRGMLGGAAATVGSALDPENAIGGPDDVGTYQNIINKPFFNRPLSTPEGEQLASRIGPPLQAFETGVVDLFGNIPGGPVPQTIGRTVGQGGLEILGIKGLGKLGKADLTPIAQKAGQIIPEVDDLFNIGRVAFNEANIKGGGVRPEALQRVLNNIKSIKNEAGIKIAFDKDVHAPAFAAQKRIIDDLEAGNVNFDELMTLRELAGDVAGNTDPAIAMRGVRMKNIIDDFVDTLSPDDVFSGNPQQAAEALAKARKFWRDAHAARTIETRIELAGNRAGQFSGSGFENALRTEFRQLHARIIKGHEKGFTPDEVAMIRRVAEGGPIENVLRWFGKFAPTGAVSAGIGGGIGFALGGPAGAVAIPALGAASRKAAEKLTLSNAEKALQTPLRRSLLSE